jgi:hypothetical protein
LTWWYAKPAWCPGKKAGSCAPPSWPGTRRRPRRTPRPAQLSRPTGAGWSSFRGAVGARQELAPSPIQRRTRPNPRPIWFYSARRRPGDRVPDNARNRQGASFGAAPMRMAMLNAGSLRPLLTYSPTHKYTNFAAPSIRHVRSPLSARGGLPTRRTTCSARGWRCPSRPGLARRSAAPARLCRASGHDRSRSWPEVAGVAPLCNRGLAPAV